MPSIVPRPAVGGGFYLRPPALAPWRGPAARPVHSEEEFQAARREAERAGYEAARAQFEEERARIEAEGARAARGLCDAARNLAEARHDLLTGAAGFTVDLAFRIARRVLRREAAADPGSVLPVVRELLQRTAAASQILVRLSPADHGWLLAHMDELPEAGGMEGLRLRVDSSIEPGGCVVETEAGSLDARIDAQLERIEEALEGVETAFPEPAAETGAEAAAASCEPVRGGESA